MSAVPRFVSVARRDALHLRGCNKGHVVELERAIGGVTYGQKVDATSLDDAISDIHPVSPSSLGLVVMCMSWHARCSAFAIIRQKQRGELHVALGETPSDGDGVPSTKGLGRA